jgi:hypothetical protein
LPSRSEGHSAAYPAGAEAEVANRASLERLRANLVKLLDGSYSVEAAP